MPFGSVPGAMLPARATAGASGFDLHACLEASLSIQPGRWVLVPTGLVMAIPEGYEGSVRARSGLALRHGIGVLNGPGTIDSDYRGEVGVLLINWGREPSRALWGPDRADRLPVGPDGPGGLGRGGPGHGARRRRIRAHGSGGQNRRRRALPFRGAAKLRFRPGQERGESRVGRNTWDGCISHARSDWERSSCARLSVRRALSRSRRSKRRSARFRRVPGRGRHEDPSPGAIPPSWPESGSPFPCATAWSRPARPSWRSRAVERIERAAGLSSRLHRRSRIRSSTRSIPCAIASSRSWTRIPSTASTSRSTCVRGSTRPISRSASTRRRAAPPTMTARSFPSPRGAFDVLSAFYRVRTMPLQRGAGLLPRLPRRSEELPAFGSPCWGARRSIRRPGTFSCLVVEPTLQSGAFFKNEGRLTIWSDRR